MDSLPTAGAPPPQADRTFEQQLRDMNEALLVSSVRQHELAEQAQKAERTLAKALAYGDDIIATLREPFLVLDQDLRVKTANRSFYDSFHVSKEETENRLVYELGNGQWNIPALRSLLDEVLSRNQSVHDFEVEHSFQTLGRKTMLLNARPFSPDSKHPELILLAVYDVSAVRQRADDLAELDRRKDEFLAMLSHELRNPLAPILNAVQLLRLQRDESGLQQRARSIIERQLGQLVHLVDDLLEVSRISTGRIHLQREQLDMRVIVECGVETVRPFIEQRRHALAVRLAPAPIWIDGDSTRLEQVVVNLLNNAVKYTDEGGHIWLSLQQEGNEAVLQVRDSGVGIAPEVMPHIFDLFTQAERSLARSQGGLGVGLALVQRLVEMHGGKVAAHSVLGQGSEFVVRLPMVLTAEPLPPLPPTEKAEPTGPSLRVLVVDDNADTATSLALLLRASGHDARMAPDGPTALEVALDYRPNVALLDIGLPGLDGYEVAKRMRQQPVLQNVVLVAITGYGKDSDLQRSQEAGFDHFLVKPAKFEKVQEILVSVSEQAT
jgi:signal transduction histidine kinase/ActR/RegA family two-component response regulator